MIVFNSSAFTFILFHIKSIFVLMTLQLCCIFTALSFYIQSVCSVLYLIQIDQ